MARTIANPKIINLTQTFDMATRGSHQHVKHSIGLQLKAELHQGNTKQTIDEPEQLE